MQWLGSDPARLRSIADPSLATISARTSAANVSIKNMVNRFFTVGSRADQPSRSGSVTGGQRRPRSVLPLAKHREKSPPGNERERAYKPDPSCLGNNGCGRPLFDTWRSRKSTDDFTQLRRAPWNLRPNN